MMAAGTTALFVPGIRKDRFDKALAARPDFIILDLEDAVPQVDRETARLQVLKWLRARKNGDTVALRVNAASSSDFEADLRLLTTLQSDGIRLHGVLLAKTENRHDVTALHAALGDAGSIIPLVENAVGLANAVEIAQSPGVARLAFGAVDFAADIRVKVTEPALQFARSSLVIASTLASLQLQPLDAPCLMVADVDAIRRHAQHGRELGFGGSLCIHPSQITPVQAGYSPTSEELKWAERVLLLPESDVHQLDGVMIDRPVRALAEATLQRAEQGVSL